MGLREVPGVVREARVQTDDVQFRAQLVNPIDRAAQRCLRDPASSIGRCCSGTRLGVNQLAGHDRFSAIPQFGSKGRSRFIEDQLDQR